MSSSLSIRKAGGKRKDSSPDKSWQAPTEGPYERHLSSPQARSRWRNLLQSHDRQTHPVGNQAIAFPSSSGTELGVV